MGTGLNFGMGLDFSQSSVLEVKYNFVFQLLAKSLVYSNGDGTSTMVTEVLYMSLAYDSNLPTICSLHRSLGNFIPVCFPLPFLLEDMLIILPVIILLHHLPAWR
jgi:hypothetical protein